MSEAEYKAAKLTRRNAKASLTRSGRALLHRIENKWSIEEIKVTLINVDKVENSLSLLRMMKNLKRKSAG